MGVLTAFQVLTLVLYIFGPISYGDQSNMHSVVFFVLLYLFAMNGGYWAAANFAIKNRIPSRGEKVFLMRAAIVSIILFVPTSMSRIGDLQAVRSVGDLYSASQAARGEGNFINEYLRFFLGFYTFGLLPVLLCAWENLSGRLRAALCVVALAMPLISIMTGVNKYLFDTIIIVFMFFVSGFLSSGGLRAVLSKKKRIIYIFLGLGIVFFAAMFFVEGQLSRSGSAAVSGVNPRIGMVSSVSADDGKLWVLYSSMTSYLTQGYRAFELASNEEMAPGYLVLNSTFLSRQFERIVGVDFSSRSLPAKIEKHGWDRYNNWSTFYVWMASDVGFFGVALLMFFIGFLVRLIANSAILFGDVYSRILLGYCFIGLFYLSANNQLLQSGETTVPFLFVLMVWLSVGKKLRLARVA